MSIIAGYGAFKPFKRKPVKKKRNRELRSFIHGMIVAKPGIHYRRILKLTDASNGSVSYHLHILEKEKAICTKTKGMFKCYYPKRKKKTKKMKRKIKIRKTE